jgi:putative methyltransferase (TIGR04325 family)
MAQVTEIFPDFESALTACGPGYNNALIADVIAFKTALAVDPRQFAPEQAVNSILAVGIAAADITERPFTVLDFGGGCGFHFFRVVAAIRSQLRWAIVETPTMAERAVKLAQGRFEVFTDIAAAAAALGPIHLVHASSSIQYVPEPLSTLKALATLRARYFMLARFPVWSRNHLVGVQTSLLAANGIGPMPPTIADRQVRYPITFTNFDDVMRVLGDYEIATVMQSPSSNYNVQGQQVQGISLVFRSREMG